MNMPAAISTIVLFAADALISGGICAAEVGAPVGATFPAKPVRVVSASAPGGGTDIIARYTAQALSELWRQQAVVDNRAGSAGAIATEILARAAPDGYTLLVQSLGVAWMGALRSNLPFDAQRDLAPVVLLASQPSLLAVHISVPVTNVAELVQLAKTRPLQYGTTGAGGASHLGTELFAGAAGIQLTAVQYKGIAPAFNALLGGEVQLALVPVSTALPQTRSGRIRALAITGAARSSLMPEVPTVREAGVAGYEFDAWYGLFAPAKTPRTITAKINADVTRVLQQPELRQRMAGAGIEPLGGSRQQFEQFFAAEVTKWGRVIATAGIQSN